ncbi:hypothetical protein BBP40_002190, partial [Aspergillus hancockii]
TGADELFYLDYEHFPALNMDLETPHLHSALFGHHSEKRHLVLHGISNAISVRDQIVSNVSLGYSSTKSESREPLRAWLRTYKASRTHSDTVPGSRDAQANQLLQVYHTIATIMASTGILSTGELIFDQHTEAFVSVIVQIVDIFK